MKVEQATLDDPAALGASDPGGMLALVADLAQQLRQGFDVGRGTSSLPGLQDIRSVVVCGMGGSGIVGDVLRASFADRMSVPLIAVKGYGLPAFCGPATMLLAVSYSGETEETLACYSQGVAAGCPAIAVSSGGRLADLAAADGVAHVLVPGHIPAPRAALGYLAGASAGVLEGVGLIPEAGQDVHRASDAVETLAAELAPERPLRENRAKSLAAWLLERIPVVWASEGVAEAAALRWKTQLNENAKVPAFHAVLPELDHNEIEGWTRGSGSPFGLVILRHPGEHPRIARRVQATLEAITGSDLECREVHSEGSAPMETALSLAILGDFVSTYLAILRGVDPTPVQALTELKERLRT